MAHSLQLTTIAEGVETEEQWRLLRDMQCDNLQGFHFYRPLTTEQMTELLRGNATSA